MLSIRNLNIELKFNSDDLNLINAAKAYWSVKPNGSWSYSINDISKVHGIPSCNLYNKVNSICFASSSSILCPSCKKPKKLRSRPHVKEITSITHAENCESCLKKSEFKNQKEFQIEAVKNIEFTVKNTLSEYGKRWPSKDYKAINIIDAILLFRIWSASMENHLIDDEICSARVFSEDRPEELPELSYILSYLFANGWIYPSIKSELAAFSVDSSGNIKFDVLLVHWKLAKDSSGFDPISILEEYSKLAISNSNKEFDTVWRMAGMIELRQIYREVFSSQGLRTYSISPKVESSMDDLLNHFSIGNACFIFKKFLNRACEHINVKGINQKNHIDNLISHMVRSNAERYVDYKWDTYPTRPHLVSKLSRILFEDDGYDTYIGRN